MLLKVILIILVVVIIYLVAVNINLVHLNTLPTPQANELKNRIKLKEMMKSNNIRFSDNNQKHVGSSSRSRSGFNNQKHVEGFNNLQSNNLLDIIKSKILNCRYKFNLVGAPVI